MRHLPDKSPAEAIQKEDGDPHTSSCDGWQPVLVTLQFFAPSIYFVCPPKLQAEYNDIPAVNILDRYATRSVA